MPDMSEEELITILDSMETDAVVNQDAFIEDNEELLRRYKGEPYGTEVPGRSKVVSQDVQDTVESDMPSLARVFLGSSEIFTFQPNTGSDRELEEAENKTKYVDWLIRKQPTSFRVLHGFLKDISLQKMGVLKYFFEETEATEEHEFKNLTIEEVNDVAEDLEARDGDVEIDVIERGKPDENGEFDIKFKTTVKRQEIKIIGIPTELFLLSQESSDLEDANLVGDKVRNTRGGLVAEGHDKGLVAQLPQVGSQTLTGSTSGNMQQIRFDDEGGFTDDEFRVWANQEVEISDLYVRIDFDGDGIAERRHIQKSGNVILVNEAFDHIPYAMASGILMPHKAIGRSRAEVVTPVAEVKTALTRQMLDNGYMVGNPKMGVNKNVNLDDYLSDAIGGVVRTKGETNPAQNMLPITVPFIGDKTLLLLQHMDQNKAQSVGNQLSSQGLNADQLNKETATRFEGVQDASQAKIELVTRVVAEVGFRKLYEGVAWMATRFQTTEREFMVLGKPLVSDPQNWKFDHHVNSEIGLGSGDSEQIVENMTGIWNIQQVLKQQGSVLVDSEKEFNALSRMTKGLEIKDVSEFFNDPEQPDELLLAENEQLKQQLGQATQMVEQLQNPLAEAETIKQQGLLIKQQSQAELQIARLAEDQRQFNAKLLQDQQENNRKQEESNRQLAIQITELELKHKKELEGGLQ